MNLLFLHTMEHENILSELAPLCAAADVPFVSWSPDLSAPDWEDTLFMKVSGSTHCCLLLAGSEETKWFLFASAFCIGRKNPLFLLETGAGPLRALPRYLSSGASGGGFDELRRFLRDERMSWKRSVIRNRVMAELEKRGIPFSAEGFAQTVSEGDRRDVRLFFKAGFPVTVRNRNGVPLLNLAVRNGHGALVPLLLSRKVDIDAVSDDRNNTALMDAAARGDSDIISDLLAAGADLDFQSKNGQTALVLAIGAGHIACAELLIRAGADVTIKDKLGMDAVMYAKLFGHTALLELIGHIANGRTT